MPEQKDKKDNIFKILGKKCLILRSSVTVRAGRVSRLGIAHTNTKDSEQTGNKKFGILLHIVRNRHYALLGICSVLLLSVALVAWSIFYFQRPVKLVYSLNNLKIDSPMTVSFSQPIQKNIRYSITPALDGTWKTSRNIFGVTALNFYPSHSLVPGSSFKLTVSNVTPILASRPSIDNQSIPVVAEEPATISSITPGSNAINVPIGTTITVKLASPNNNLRKLVLKADAPLVSSEPTTSDGITFVWKFTQPLSQGQLYHLTLSDLKQINKNQLLATTAFTTVPEPHISSATNSDHFYPGNKITVVFDQDMEKADGVFKFGFAGSGSWQDSHTYSFSPSGLSPGTFYSYTVLKGSASVAGGVTETNHVFNISPPGAVYVTTSSPKGNNVALGSSVDFTFDQPVDRGTAQSAFSISPSVAGTFSWTNNTMSFHPVSLDYQTDYVAKIGPGVKGIYGLVSTRSYSNNFTTTYRIIKLGVPYFRQAYALSCEEASLRMALAYRGINVSDYDILVKVGYNPRPRDLATNSWDNPYQMYVGDVNGNMGTTGWGTYGPPIAAAAQSFGRNTSYISGISVNQIAQAIYDDDPVVIWGIVGSSARSDSWNTSSGIVQAPRNTHVRTVYGVAGSVNNPIGFYVHDPLHGDLYWTAAQMQLYMSFGNSLPSQGVIVY